MKEYNMKKLFIGLFTASIMLFMSSCVVVADKPAVVVVEPLFYSITFVNDTEENVIDWYVNVIKKLLYHLISALFHQELLQN